MISQPDRTALIYNHQHGEWTVHMYDRFDKHLIRLHKLVKKANKMYPCNKGAEFINYVLSNEPLHYPMRVKF